MKFSSLIFLLLVCLVINIKSMAGQMRSFDPIPKAKTLPEGAEAVSDIEQVDEDAVTDTVDQLANGWNNENIDDLLSDDFQEKSRLNDALLTNVPADAQMQIDSVRGVSTLQQTIMTTADGQRQRISTVTATVATRLQIQDPTSGFVSVPGTNEIVFEVVEILE